ncbi:MAG: hypothetical protein ACJ8AW_29445 [Rhodopila sp.]
MRSLRFTMLASLALALSDCGVGMHQVAEARYECHPAEQPNGNARFISIHPAADSHSLELFVNQQPRDVLQPLGRQQDHIYAGNAYAWRQDDPVSVLTDIAAAETFHCGHAAGMAAR